MTTQSELLFTDVSSTSSDLLFVDDVSVKIIPTIVNDGNLLFNDNAETDGNLLFIGQEIGVVVQDVSAAINASFPALTLEAHVVSLFEIQLQSSFPAVSIVATGMYDSDTARPVVSRLQTTFNTAIKLAAVNSSAVRRLQHAPFGTTTAWAIAQSLRFGVSQDIQQLSRLHHAAELAWANAVPLRAPIQSHFNDLLKNIAIAQSAFSDARPVQITRHIQFADRLRKRSSVASHWRTALSLSFAASDKFSSGIAYCLDETERFQAARVPPIGISYVPSVKPPIVYVGDTNLVFAEPVTNSASLVFGNTYVIPGSAIIVPIRRTYIVLNNVQLRRIDGNHILPATSLQLNIDWDSWTWSFSTSMPQSTLSLVEPGQSGDLVTLEATINGAAYLLLAENIQTDRTFGKSTISVSGRGKSAMLADPYSPILTFNSAVDRTAQQLMNDALTVNGISIGWAIDWRIDDWLVPANTWNHQGSYMSAITTIAGAAGAFVQPDPVNQVLRVRSRYSVKPWEYASATPDLELPSAVMTKEAISWVDNPQYNGIYVSGSTNSGILAQVKRTGSAANNLAPMITDSLITAVEPARARGIVALANTGRNATYTLSLPVLPETGIVQPGTLVRYVDSSTVMGVVTGVAVSAEQSKVRQTIEVQTHG